MNQLGLRVLRGPDWNHGDADGGDGHLGTIVNIGGLSTAQVQWDNGQQCVCRIGENGHHDLRVFDSGPVGVRHMECVCSSCSERGIFGMRWQCQQCSDVNLCPICYVTDKHNINHPFLRFDTPQSKGVEIPKRSVGLRCQAVGIFPGATVKRGRDWKWDNQDGGDGKTGEVISINNNTDSASVRNVVNVKWSPTGRTYAYRLGGIDGKVDLIFVEQSRGPFYYRDHLPVCVKEVKLNVNRGATSSGAGPETEPGPDILKEGDKVSLTVSDEDLKKLHEEHGPKFIKSMQNCMGKIGEIKGFSQNGDAWVDFSGVKFRLFAGFFSKVYDFKMGDVVRILDDEEKIKKFQEGQCGYKKEMKHYLGKVGQVIKVDSDGDLHVQFGRRNFVYRPMCCLPAPGEEVYEGGDEDADLENVTFNLLGLGNAMAMMMMVNRLKEAVTQSVSITVLIAAIIQNDISMLRTVLDESPGLMNTLHEGNTPLYIASHQGHRAIVLELLNRGADINKVDKLGNTPLMVSISGKEPAIAKLLIEKGANVKIVGNNGRTALHFAAYSDYGNLVDMIIKKDCDINSQDSDGDTALHDAIEAGSKNSVVVLCRASTLHPRLANKKGFNVLHFACFKNNTIAVDKILDKHKSLVNVKESDGFAALHIAAVNNHTDCAKRLIEKGNADIHVKDSDGSSPLATAAVEGGLECVQLLIDKNADVNAVDGNKCTALHACCMKGSSHSDVQNTLAALMGISLSSDSDTEGRIKVAMCLIRNGARTDLENVNGKTPLQCCTDKYIKWSLSEFIRQRLVGGSGLFRCIQCLSSPANTTLEPCTHKCVCRECALRAIKCPACEKFILERVTSSKCCIQ